MPARSYLKQTYQASSETYDTPSSNTNMKLGSNATNSNLGVYTSPRILNPRGHQRPPPPPLTAHTTQTGSQKEEETKQEGYLDKPTKGLETPTLLLDDNHRSTPIQPTRTDTPETTTHAPPRWRQKTTPNRTRPRSRRRMTEATTTSLFLFFYLPHNIGLVLLFLTIHMIRDTIFY